MTAIKAKPTVYGNTRFRSRLEARWAAFFDAIEREWIYEPQLPELSRLGYQPDFMTDNGVGGTILVEIKPLIDDSHMFDVMHDERWQQVANLASCQFVVLMGQPGEWVEGQLADVGHYGMVFGPGKNDYWFGQFAECLKCELVRIWPQGVSTCHPDLPTGPLATAFAKVRDTSFEAGAA